MSNMVTLTERELNGFFLFKSLVKDGCVWSGDVCSREWSERLRIPAGLEEQVEMTLGVYADGVEYRREGEYVWIA